MTSQGEQIWVQRGFSEIFAIDIARQQSELVYDMKENTIGSWNVSRDGATVMFSSEREVLIYRDQELIVSETFPGLKTLEAGLSIDGARAIQFSGNSTIRSWDLTRETPKCLDFVVEESIGCFDLNSHRHELAVAALSGELKFYDLDTGKLHREFLPEGKLTHSPVYSGDGTVIAAISNELLTVYDCATGKIIWSFKDTGCTANKPFGTSFHGLMISPDGKLLAVANVKSGIRVFDTATGQAYHQIPTGGNVMYRFCFALDSNRIYGGGNDGSICEWTLSTSNYRKLKLNEGPSVVSR
jgi:WD40 repeat protein